MYKERGIDRDAGHSAFLDINKYSIFVYFDSPTLWQAIYPTQWARGNWSFDYNSPDLDRDLKSVESSTESLISNSSTAEDSSSDSTAERRGT